MTVIEEAKRLISIPSVTKGEAVIGKYLAERLESLGCKTRIVPIDGDRFNVIGILEGESDDKMGILFHGHMDTIAPYGMENPFTPEVRDGYIWGRGSADQKGGIAATLAAVEMFTEKKKVLKKSIGVFCVIDEEEEHKGSMALADMNIQSDFAVVTEPTALKIGVGCKGSLPIRIVVRGRASHGCRPWLGESAVLHGMNIVNRILSEELPEYEIGKLGKHKASINLGIVDGGVAYNIVPDSCVFCFDRRMVLGETWESVMGGMQRIIDDYDKPDDVSVILEIARPDWNWGPIKLRGLLPAITDPDSEVVTLAQEAHRRVTEEEPQLYVTDGYNEMDFLINDHGIPTVQYGPGDGSLCHTSKEMLDIRQLEIARDVYSEMIRRSCE